MPFSAQAHAAAVDYLKTHARPLETALYGYLFERGSAEPVILALAAFQNPDGGFGHALEPDIRLSGSSVIATTIAISHFRTLGLMEIHPMVAAACGYLNAQYLPDKKRWRIMPPNVDDGPHAPWWAVGGELWNNRANPTAEVLGYLYEYPAHFSDGLRTEVTQAMTAHLAAQGDKLDMFELHCYVRLVENPAVPADLKAALMPKLTTLVSNTVQRDPNDWKEYGIPPLTVIPSPDSAFASLFAAELPANLDFMMGWQGTDGGWHPNWNWGDGSDAWTKAERDGTSILTLENLKTLRAFGLIDGL